MEPTREGRATLVDLLDRILEKGLVINADVIISLAGVALIAVNLRAAVASVDTMLSYGLMKDFIQNAGWSADEGTKQLGAPQR